MNLLALPAFDDNYIWMLHDGQQAVVVDPGDEKPVAQALRDLGLKLQAILVTHHHADHVGGVVTLKSATGARVYGPAGENIPGIDQGLAQGDTCQVLGLEFQVIDVPGHTAGHIAWFHPSVDGAPILFCGDTLFSGGCGRLFEGTAAQMLSSLDKFSALPDNTRVCCAHEYTLSNLRFARVVEPENTALIAYEQQCRTLRERALPTLPSTIAQEREINPFMRTRSATITDAMRERSGTPTLDEVGVFAALRRWKNEFR